MRPIKLPVPGREWKLLHLNLCLCFVYFVFVFFVFLNLRLCLGEKGNKNVRCRKLLLSESREGNALSPNYLYRLLSILHSLFNRFCTAFNKILFFCNFCRNSGLDFAQSSKERETVWFQSCSKVNCLLSDVRWHNYPSVTQSFCLKNEIHTTFSSARLLLTLSNTCNTITCNSLNYVSSEDNWQTVLVLNRV